MATACGLKSSEIKTLGLAMAAVPILNAKAGKREDA
jgi:hypothetical protein